MASPSANHFLIVGAGAAGLMAGRELARAGKRVTILEARDRCGGRIHPLPAQEFGYPAEGGAEFIHGAAPVTRALMGEAGLSLSPIVGTRWNARGDELLSDDSSSPHMERLIEALAGLKADLPIAEFLDAHFAGRQYASLRQSIIGMVEGYDAADPARASTFALRDEWLGEGLEQQGRIAEGYGALIDFLAAACRELGVSIRLGITVTAVEAGRGGVAVRCGDGTAIAADAAILTLPLPCLATLALPPSAREKAAAVADIGFGSVVKFLMRFRSAWWTGHGGRDRADLAFLFADAAIPTWWTQHPAGHPVLTGWYAGPKAGTVAALSEEQLVAMGLAALAGIFDRTAESLKADLVAARAIDWGRDPFARGAYSYATPRTREAQAALRQPDGGAIFFAGEAFYTGRDMGTVEAALANGQETAQAILADRP